ncbi:MAG: 4-hydroxy-tetrahydrodipicolinate reductase [Lentimicrobiaceae bacterium]|nr:4-hydroxy-tetrahydrodipicolinate reductase [Lentimicrobiaceae bacterium]
MNIIILGYGKMGHEVEQVALQRGHIIIARIDNSSELENLKTLKSEKRSDSEEVVAIEFSTPATALNNIYRCFDMNIPVVCGTTAWYQHLDEVKSRCENENQALFYAPNFSIGMNIMFMLNKQLAKLSENYNYRLSLTETHHIHKLDKPSGTAVKLAEDIIENNDNYKSWELNQLTIDNLQLTSNNEQLTISKVLPVEAIREGDVFGIHEVKAESDCDIIQLRHEAFSRKGFATGAVIAAEFLLGKKGIFTMENLLKI